MNSRCGAGLFFCMVSARFSSPWRVSCGFSSREAAPYTLAKIRTPSMATNSSNAMTGLRAVAATGFGAYPLCQHRCSDAHGTGRKRRAANSTDDIESTRHESTAVGDKAWLPLPAKTRIDRTLTTLDPVSAPVRFVVYGTTKFNRQALIREVAASSGTANLACANLNPGAF